MTWWASLVPLIWPQVVVSGMKHVNCFHFHFPFLKSLKILFCVSLEVDPGPGLHCCFLAASPWSLQVTPPLPDCRSSVARSCPALCDSIDCSMPGLPVLHCLPELAQTHVHWVSNANQLSCPLFSPSALSLSQHQGLFQWDSSSHQVAKVLELQL